MENKDQDINKKVHETLASLDGVSRASANPFLFTRVWSGIQQKPETVQSSRIWKTAAGLAAMLVLNLGIYYYALRPSPPETSSHKGSAYFNDTYYSYTASAPWKN